MQMALIFVSLNVSMEKDNSMVIVGERWVGGWR